MTTTETLTPTQWENQHRDHSKRRLDETNAALPTLEALRDTHVADLAAGVPGAKQNLQVSSEAVKTATSLRDYLERQRIETDGFAHVAEESAVWRRPDSWGAPLNEAYQGMKRNSSIGGHYRGTPSNGSTQELGQARASVHEAYARDLADAQQRLETLLMAQNTSAETLAEARENVERLVAVTAWLAPLPS